jgi:maltose alpha-D-glucosyltransferase/alpha-amylase
VPALRRAIGARSRKQLQDELLLPYLQARRWFAAKGQKVARVEVVEEQEWHTPEGSWLLTLLEVQGADAPPQHYFLPLGIAWEEAGEDPIARYGAVSLARVREKARVGVLFDAFSDAAFCRALGRAIGSNAPIPFGKGHLECAASPAWPALADALDEEVHQPAMEQSNTGVFFGTRLYLKGYRRLQSGINPEVEIGHFLAAGDDFPQVAKVAGSIAWIAPEGGSAALALLQEYADNRGNVWDYT